MKVPFELLRTFVVVAGARRMAAGAGTLGLTPGAVSQRIKELEALVGHRLLLRSPSGIELTRAGKRFLEAVGEPIRALEAAYDAASGRAPSQHIVVTTTPSFAANWLVERLTDFAGVYPNIEITVDAGGAVVDLRTDPVDLAIRHGLGDYPGLESHWLMAPAQIVVGSPQLLEGGEPIVKPEDCMRYPLLHDLARKDWEYWLTALGRKGVAVPKSGHAFSDDALVVRAAVAGQGLALVYDAYAAKDIAAGRLVQPYKRQWPSRFAYYLVGLPRTFRRPAVRQFKAWLTAEASKGW